MPVAPASRAARTTSASCSGRSEMPGRIGAIPTPALMPRVDERLQRAQALARGRRAGSVFRHTSSSSVGIENVTDTSARAAASASTSRSRTIIGPRVIMLNGLRARGERLEARAREPVVALGRLVGSVAAPIATGSPLPRRARELAREHLGDVVLTRIERP